MRGIVCSNVLMLSVVNVSVFHYNLYECEDQVSVYSLHYFDSLYFLNVVCAWYCVCVCVCASAVILPVPSVFFFFWRTGFLSGLKFAKLAGQ